MEILCQPFTVKEEKRILRYIIDNEYYNCIRGNVMYMKMEKELQTRPWQNLKNHLLKHLLPKVDNIMYDLPTEVVKKLREGYSHSATSKKTEGLEPLFQGMELEEGAHVSFSLAELRCPRSNKQLSKLRNYGTNAQVYAESIGLPSQITAKLFEIEERDTEL